MGDKYDSFNLIKNSKGQNTLVDQAPTLSSERLDLPSEYQKRYKSEQMEEYRTRFQDCEARKPGKKG